MPRENTSYRPRTVTTQAPMSREDVLSRINSYQILYGMLPERIQFDIPGSKPVYKSVLAYIVDSIDGEANDNT